MGGWLGGRERPRNRTGPSIKPAAQDACLWRGAYESKVSSRNKEGWLYFAILNWQAEGEGEEKPKPNRRKPSDDYGTDGTSQFFSIANQTRAGETAVLGPFLRLRLRDCCTGQYGAGEGEGRYATRCGWALNKAR